MRITFTVYAKPEPQGSVRAFTPRGWSRPVLTSDNPALKAYRKEVAKAAFSAVGEPFGKDAALAVSLRFFIAKPPSAKREWPTVRPDLDKYVRATLDALKEGGVYADDSQVCRITETEKRYAADGIERVEITIETIEKEKSDARAA